MGVQLIMGFADAGSGFLSKISTGFTGANNISSPGGYSRKHPIRVSAMKYISAGFNFIVTLNEFTFGFKNVSGIFRFSGSSGPRELFPGPSQR